MKDVILKKGLIKGFIYNDTISMESIENLDYIAIKNEREGKEIIVKKDEIPLGSFSTLKIGKLVDYIELSDDEGSMKGAMPIKRREIIEGLKAGKITSATITSINKWGAFVSIQGVSCLIRNCDFASDYSTIEDVYKQYDEIEGLMLRKVSDNERICLEKTIKYKSKNYLKKYDIKVGNLVLGTIANIKKFGCFVRLSEGIDILMEIPSYEIEEGNRVVCKITKVEENKESLKVRGKMLKVIS